MKDFLRFFALVGAGIIAGVCLYIFASNRMATSPGNLHPEQNNPESIILDKVLEPGHGNERVLRLEAYVTGQSQTIKRDVSEPMDFIVIIDRNVLLNNEKWANGPVLKYLNEGFADFLDNVERNSGVYTHKIAIIDYKGFVFDDSWAGDGLTLESCWLDLDSQTVANIRTRFTNGGYYDGSSPYSAMSDPEAAFLVAERLLKDGAVADDGRRKAILFFSPGIPADNGSGAFAVGKAARAVNVCARLKSEFKGLTVSSIVFYRQKNSYDNGESSKGKGWWDVRRFMHYMSSNYSAYVPDNYDFRTDNPMLGGTGDKGSEPPHDFYSQATAESFSSLFKTLEEVIINGSSNASLNSSSEIRDFMMDGVRYYSDSRNDDGSFDYSDVDISIVRYLGDNAGVAGWEKDSKGNEVKLDPATIGQHPRVVASSSDSGQIIVDGFDFSRYWCGRDMVSGAVHEGYKIVVRIPIRIEKGGIDVLTNTDRSGVYQDAEETRASAWFPRPVLDLPNIVIRKYGLRVGENAIFEVRKIGSGEEPWTVIATCKTQDGIAEVPVWVMDEARYSVTETEWAWAYGEVLVKDYAEDDAGNGGTVASGRTITRNVNRKTNNPAANGTLYEFKVDSGSTPAHSENVVLNVFENGGEVVKYR